MSDDTGDASLAEALRAAVQAWVFPAHGGDEVTTSWPFVMPPATAP